MSGAGAPDFFYREAQRLGYVARSAFKVLFRSFTPSFTTSFYQSKSKSVSFSVRVKQLLQMQKQYKLITPGSSVLDLGCAPGAWLQVLNWKLFHGFFDLFFMGFMVLWLYFLVVGGLPEFGSAQKWWGGCGH
jgi:hypothetical protein